MLDGLDRTDWAGLTHAYGPAADVPGLLRALASRKKAVRDEALDTLCGNIWHQGTVYEATAHAVPFLVELLATPAIAGKAELLSLLHALATGRSYRDVHQHLDFYHVERTTEAYQVQLRKELEDVRAARAAVVAGTPTYVRLLAARTPGVRTAAAHLLSECAERAAETEPLLRARLAAEADAGARAGLLAALTVLWRGSSDNEPVRLLTAAAGDRSEEDVVRFVAALGAVELGGAAAVGDALSVFHETVAGSRDAFENLHWVHGGSPVFAASAVLAPHPERQLQWLFDLFDHPDAGVRGEAVWALSGVCRQRRSAPAAVAPRLARVVADADPEVRDRAARALPELGRARLLAADALEALGTHADPAVRALAAETLTKVRASRSAFATASWPKPPQAGKSVPELVAVLEAEGGSLRHQKQHACMEAVVTLEYLGAAAAAAAPALRNVLKHPYQWVRVYAARALWKAADDAGAALPVLLAEFRCRPTGVLAAECLGEMGRHARAAVPALRRVIESETRLVEIGSYNDWIDSDDGFCDAARQALARIEADEKR
jgi:hypothetical protein